MAIIIIIIIIITMYTFNSTTQLSVQHFTVSGPSSVCDSSELCGWNSDCLDNKCVCKSGYSLASNKRDCIDST